jgi:DNA invertase Pin-like site-specific DNA recombinase
MQTGNKISLRHLERIAVVYVRQSSPKQVQRNEGSQINQRALVERAVGLGWHTERIRLMDADLGQSAAQADGRADFAALTAEVALGQIGIIFGWEVSRLARNNADWYRLLDLAALFGTLIADVEGIYDPRLYNDRLLLGLKGTMSEAELHMMRQRLNAGRVTKVLRGEYRQRLPTGLIRLPDGSVVKDPDDQVRHVIEFVFAKFAELGTCQKVLRHCKRHEILLPRHQSSGTHAGETLWKKPSAAAIYSIVCNPAYAGTFAYGRRPSDPTRRIPGRPATGFVRKPMTEWFTIQQGVYPAYISWEEYVANQAQLRDNGQRHRDQKRPGRGTARQGAGLLQGLATCGACGHVMKVAYKPGVRYHCDGLSKDFAEPMCPSFEGPAVEGLVVEAFLTAIQPAQLDALEALLARRREERAQIARHWQEQRQRATYEAHLARRRYEAVDPDNRLVAADLERRWEEKLVTLREIEEGAARFDREPADPSVDPQLRYQFEQIARCLPELWTNGRLDYENQKHLLRSLISRVILKRPVPDRADVTIVWVSGHFSTNEVTLAVHRQPDISGYNRLLARLRDLWQEGRTDEQMARILTREGFHSARSRQVSPSTVLRLRHDQGWVSNFHRHRQAHKVDGYWTVYGLAQELGVGRKWLYRHIVRGTFGSPDLIRTPHYGTYLIPDDPDLIDRLRSDLTHSAGNTHS